MGTPVELSKRFEACGEHDWSALWILDLGRDGNVFQQEEEPGVFEVVWHACT
jgi:hypothetical protein